MTKALNGSSDPRALSRHINSYAIGATAAGVSALALAPLAQAKVVYTPVQVNLVGPHSFYQIDLNHDGIVDFSLSNAVTITTDQFFWQLLLGIPVGNAALGTFVGHGFPIDARAMNSGSKIGPGGAFYQSRGMLASVYYGGGGLNVQGNWADVSNRYLGVRFQINGETHFGWVRLNVQINTTKLTVFSRVTGYAYETTPNQAIDAGETHDDVEVRGSSFSSPSAASKDTTGVHSSMLGALALGSDGIAIWRPDEES